MDERFEKVLFSEEVLSARIKEIANQIDNDYKDKNPLLVSVLKGSVVFYVELIKNIKTDVNLDFISASSYGSGTTSSGNVIIKKDLDFNIEGRHVILVDDIIDSGNTMYRLIELLSKRNPASIKTCVLLDKPARREVAIEADYCGFKV
ncbi:MAG: hypoxanthine phosphoribosyltransferase, partial [Clostridia bacterium]|nr:hypoxanthine phosphoribosyltransferase [Clostridia bacterium]